QFAVSELTALALLGQRLRFRRHGPPPQNAKPPIVDSREIVPDAARPLMRGLVGGEDRSAISDLAALCLVDTCHRHCLRPHPFDVPRLSVFVRAHGEFLGAYAAAWAERDKPEKNRAGDYFDDANDIDPSNWTSARPAVRAEFIATMRRREPDRARELLTTSFL